MSVPSESEARLDPVVTVMMSPARVPDDDNPFVHMLVSHLDPDVKVVDFAWAAAFLTNYDVLHIHWPERMTNSPNKPRSVVKSLAFMLLILLNRARSVAHVGTVHNLRPHESGTRLEQLAVRLWNWSCNAKIYLSRAGMAGDDSGVGVYIPHGDYGPFVSDFEHAVVSTEEGRLLVFGYLRPYKGIEQLIRTLSVEPSLRLTVAGKPISSDYADSLASASSGAVDLRMQSQSSDELVSLITRSEVIVLPYRHIYNSGAAILALTLGRPIIVTSSPTMVELQHEVGGEWLQLIPENADLSDLKEGLRKLRESTRGDRAPMSERDWSRVGPAHADLYRTLCRGRLGGKRRPSER